MSPCGTGTKLKKNKFKFHVLRLGLESNFSQNFSFGKLSGLALRLTAFSHKQSILFSSDTTNFTHVEKSKLYKNCFCMAISYISSFL